MGNCKRCKKSNEYQDDDYLCWECKDISSSTNDSKPTAGVVDNYNNTPWVKSNISYIAWYQNNLCNPFIKIKCKHCNTSAGNHSSSDPLMGGFCISLPIEKRAEGVMNESTVSTKYFYTPEHD